jgi:HD-GYP domain-containing protein (c-di-GMP phosphodiesterase class II)
MTSDRPYRKAFSRQDAIKELEEGKGIQFDPKVVDSFLEVLKDENHI